MSTIDTMDDALLGADDDELDYDLEKEEEDALLADDSYEEHYDDTPEEIQHQQYEEPVQIEEENDILDIDSNVHLDETEEDFGDQKPNILAIQVNRQEPDDEEEINEQKERNRFLNERNTSVQRSTSNEIPDTLDKVAVQPVYQPQSNNNNNRNGRFQRNHNNRGRGRGRQNQNRGSVFGRVGKLPIEAKTVLINPHFRGNVQVSDNARLVWDANYQNNNNFSHSRYSSPQMAQVAPFQNQPSPWINPPYIEPNSNFNHPPMQSNYQEPPPQHVQYNQSPDMINTGIRPLLPPPFSAQQTIPPQQQITNWCDDQNYCESMYPPQGNFRGRDVRFLNNATVPPLMMNPPQNFNPQPNYNFLDNQNIPNQNRTFINPNHQNAAHILQNQPNYSLQTQNFDQLPPQQFMPQNHFAQNRSIPPLFESYNDQNQFQSPPNQFQSSVTNNQNFQGQNFQQPLNYNPNFIPNQPVQESFPPKQYNHQNRQNNQHQRHQMNNYNRSPPKRRGFENSVVSGDRDMPKKKKRSMELSNLHEVPTVDMPDTTIDDKEEEDEETKEYRLKIEEQKKLREKILREKEERRKLAAAQKVENVVSSSASIPTGNLITTLKTRNIAIANPQQQQPIVRQQIQQMNQLNQQCQQQISNLLNRKQQRPKPLMQQRKQIQNNPQRPQNIQVQTNAVGQRLNQGRSLQQRRGQQHNQQANIVVTQKNEQIQSQRIVLLKQNTNPQKANPNRRVVLKGMNTIHSDSIVVNQPESQSSQDNGVLSSFLSNRKVISKSNIETSGVELNQGNLLETSVVVVSNLAAGTTDVKIRKLCQGLGPIQNIQMIPNARQATIRFKNIVSAHKFFKKYQRKIVDLSMIQVSLEPES